MMPSPDKTVLPESIIGDATPWASFSWFSLMIISLYLMHYAKVSFLIGKVSPVIADSSAVISLA